MQVWITADALNKGIRQREVESCLDYKGAVREVRKKGQVFVETYYQGDWHLTEEEAVAAAEKMRKRLR